MKITDKVINSVTGRNMETVPVTLEQFVEILKKEFIAKADTDEELNAIQKAVNGGLFLDKILPSKDGNFEIHCSTGNGGFTNRNWIWIHDAQQDKYFEYRAWNFKSLKRAVQKEIADAKLKQI